MFRSYIFTVEHLLSDIKVELLEYVEYDNVRLHYVLSAILDEVCYIQGCGVAEGEYLAITELQGHDVPDHICRVIVDRIKSAIVEKLLPVVTGTTPYRLSHIQLNEFEYCLTIYFYKGRRYSINPGRDCYATTIPHHWAQSID